MHSLSIEDVTSSAVAAAAAAAARSHELLPPPLSMRLLFSSSHELSRPCSCLTSSLRRRSRAASSLLAGGLSSSLLVAVSSAAIDFGDFFKGPLPGKFLKLLGFLALSRLGVYIPLASCTGISEVARSSEKRRRGWKKESSSIHSICVSWICNCTAEADMQKLSHALKVISKNQRTWFTAALLQLSAEEYPPADATDDKLYLKGATNRDGDFCSTSSTGESLKNIATEICQSSRLKAFLRKQGKLSSLCVNQGCSITFQNFTEIAGEPIEAERLYDVVNVVLSLQIINPAETFGDIVIDYWLQ
ncbi:hypothetical protein S83_066730 [Arachis hypogaea]